MKWMVVVLLAVCPVLVDAQTNDKGKNTPDPGCSEGTQPTLDRARRGSDVLRGGCERQTTVYYIDGVLMPVSGVQPEQVKPLRSGDNPTAYILNRGKLNRLPYTNVNDALSLFPGVYQQQRGADISIYGSR